MMTFGLTVLMLFAEIYKTKSIKANKKLILLCLITLIGVLSVVLAPAEFVRMNTEQNVNRLEIAKDATKFIAQSFFASKSAFLFMFLFNLLSGIYAFQKGEKKERIVIMLICILNFIINCYHIFINKSAIFDVFKILAILLSIICYGIIIIYLNKKIYGTKLVTPLTIAIILMVGSEFMMIVSPVIGERNMLSCFMMFAVIICIIASKVNLKKESIIVAIIIVITLLVNLRTAIGYRQTRIEDTENVKIIQEYKKANKDGKLELYTYSDENYAWSLPYRSEFHEKKYKKFYDIVDAQIEWKER